MFQRLFVLVLFSALVGDAVKIGISKPATAPDNTTKELIETTTLEPTTTITTTTSTTTKTVITSTALTSTTRKTTAKPGTKVTTRSTSTTTTTTPSSTSTTPTTTTPTTTTPTTTTPTTTSSASPIPNTTQLSPIRNQNIDYSRYYCRCDLRHHHCDINCCCDIDCIAEELNSFDCHQEDYSHLGNINYQQGLPPCKINEGWLCVFRNNFDDTKHKQVKYVVDASAYHEWPELLLETKDLSKDRSYYKIGEPILLYNLELNEIVEYDIPFSLVGEQCQIVESIRHLTSHTSSCHTTLENVHIFEAALFQKLYTSLLLQGPNIQVTLVDLDELIPITLFRCTNDLDCVVASTNSTYYDDSDYSSLIQTKIYHNITNLIRCDVFFVRSSNKADTVWQHYQIEFIPINENDLVAAASEISGPLGYNIGSPLIFGHKVPLNETADHADSNLILDYFHPNKTGGVHILLPRRRQGQCEESQAKLNFGESILLQCSVQLDNSTELNGETNFTRVCADLQRRSLQLLGVSDMLRLREDYFVSVLGYPANRTDLWIKIDVRNYEHLPVVGTYLEKEHAFLCQNMILGLKYEFFNVRDAVQGVQHQNLLKRAAIQMGRRHDLQFELNEAISIPITFTAVFHDLREISGAVKEAASCVFLSVSISIFI